MFVRAPPEWLRMAPRAGVHAFAALNGIEAMVRGMLISVFPLAMYEAFHDAATTSEIYFVVGLISLFSGLLVPWFNRRIPRRWLFTIGALFYVVGCAFGVVGGAWVAASLLCNAIATAVVFVCVNAYVLDYIARHELTRSETLRMFYGGLAWTIGPVLGVTLMKWWAPAPFIVAGVAAIALLATFWAFRLGNGKAIVRARQTAPNPLAYFGRFAAQPRLVAGWLFAVLRSCGWWVYVVYLPIFALQSGFDERTGGYLLAASNALLFTTPLMMRYLIRPSLKRAIRIGFFSAGLLFLLAAVLADLPALALAALFLATVFLILLDVSAGLPFLMAVKPSERTEMSAIYSSFRDMSGVMTPGIAWLVLLVAPLPAVFAAAGGGLFIAWGIAGRLHHQLGIASAIRRQSRERPLTDVAGRER